MNKIKLAICDDHPLIVEGIKSYCQNSNTVNFVFNAEGKASLFNSLLKNKIDVLLLDIYLKDGECGAELCKEILLKYPELKIVGLSNVDNNYIILKMINNGAVGYLFKSASLSEILVAVETVFAGGVFYCYEAQLALSQSYKIHTEKPVVTKRESEVLNLLAKGLSSAEIAMMLFISIQTVDSHRKSLLNKFKVNKTVNLIAKAKEFNII